MNEEKEHMSLKRRKTFLWVVREGEGGGASAPFPIPSSCTFPAPRRLCCKSGLLGHHPWVRGEKDVVQRQEWLKTCFDAFAEYRQGLQTTYYRLRTTDYGQQTTD